MEVDGMALTSETFSMENLLKDKRLATRKHLNNVSKDIGNYSKWHKYLYDLETIYPMSEEKIEKLRKKERLLKNDIGYLISRFIFNKAYMKCFYFKEYVMSEKFEEHL